MVEVDYVSVLWIVDCVVLGLYGVMEGLLFGYYGGDGDCVVGIGCVVGVIVVVLVVGVFG